MSAPTPMRGFEVHAADAWRLTCERCGDSEVVGLGAGNADVDAQVWAQEHLNEKHPEVIAAARAALSREIHGG